jgi:hypothetical protein
MNPNFRVVVFPGQEQMVREILGLPDVRRDIAQFEKWQQTPDDDSEYSAIRVALLVSQDHAAHAKTRL